MSVFPARPQVHLDFFLNIEVLKLETFFPPQLLLQL